MESPILDSSDLLLVLEMYYRIMWFPVAHSRRLKVHFVQ